MLRTYSIRSWKKIIQGFRPFLFNFTFELFCHESLAYFFLLILSFLFFLLIFWFLLCWSWWQIATYRIIAFFLALSLVSRFLSDIVWLLLISFCFTDLYVIILLFGLSAVSWRLSRSHSLGKVRGFRRLLFSWSFICLLLLICKAKLFRNFKIWFLYFSRCRTDNFVEILLSKVIRGTPKLPCILNIVKINFSFDKIPYKILIVS